MTLAPSPTSVTTGTGAGYVIKLDNFEGPLELLLYLIERQELDITAVSIARVTDQYLAFLAQADSVPPALMADFVAMAARLLQIKSRALLPRPPVDTEEDEEDPGEVLARQLRAYKQFREVARLLKEREQAHLRAYVRVAPPPELERRLEPGEVSLADLLAALKRVLEEKEDLLPEATVVTPYTVTIQDKMGELRELLQKRRQVDFSQFLRHSQHKQEVIVSFLAVLELIKQGEVEVRQETTFGRIVIEVIPQPSPPSQSATSDMSMPA